MKLLAISGGPDSMFLLNEYKNKNIIVAHVNYNVRKDSIKDEQLVRDFCYANKILIEVLSVKEKPKGNFQSQARKIRYDFFEKVYKKFDCNKLLMAHHKDDFLETALMQQQSGRTPRFFGIKKKNVIQGMNIYRPYIFLYWKREILRMLHSKSIDFATDSSNDKPIYERNKVRLELMKDSLSEKRNKYQWFKMSNKILKKKFKRIDNAFARWKAHDFSVKYFRMIPKFKEEIVYELINYKFNSVKLSKAKLNSIIDFIEGKDGGKSFKLSDKLALSKKNGKVT